MAQPDPGAVSKRPHHISSIAHLFLGGDEPQSDPVVVAPVLDAVVASPGETPASALAAAGLTIGAPGGATLVEDAKLRWSAATHFVSSGDMPSLGRREGPFPCKRWEIGDEDQRTLNCYHLGSLRQEKLAHLEAMAASKSIGSLDLSGVDAIVWCLLHREVAGSHPAYVLGRLAEILKPRMLQILVFPDAWSRAGLPGWLDEIHGEDTSRWSGGDLHGCAERARMVCGPIPVETVSVSGIDNLARGLAAPELEKSLWRRLPLQMTDDGTDP